MPVHWDVEDCFEFEMYTAPQLLFVSGAYGKDTVQNMLG
jgi:hypothetical protein